jgi:hypothetical protein
LQLPNSADVEPKEEKQPEGSSLAKPREPLRDRLRNETALRDALHVDLELMQASATERVQTQLRDAANVARLASELSAEITRINSNALLPQPVEQIQARARPLPNTPAFGRSSVATTGPRLPAALPSTQLEPPAFTDRLAQVKELL